MSSGVGQRIANLRQIKGLSLPDLAERAGISKGYLSQLENEAEPNPSIGILARIADALDTTIADLLGQPRVGSRVQASIPNTLPAGLKEFLESEKRRGAPVPEDIALALAQLEARGRKISKEDWAFLCKAIKKAMGRD